ncbi:MAG: hypothetical protein ACHQ4G_04885, partial [Opitutales bacterium]
FRSLDTAGIADALGVACHAVRADFTLARNPRDFALRGLGIENHPDSPYRVVLRGLPMDFHHEDNTYRTRIQTSAWEISFTLEHTVEMKREGISIPFVREFPIHSVDDFPALGEIFEHLVVIPTPEAYAAFHQRIGERGIAVAFGPLGASPMHFILHELVAPEQFFYLYADEREALARLARRMEPFCDRALEAALGCAAEVIYWGGNYDQNLTWPAFFLHEIAPWLKRAADRAHAAGKFLLTHTDGENERLLPLYPDCGFDVAESVCPRPMTRCSLREVRAGMGPRTTIWGGIPSLALLPAHMDDRDFEAYLDDLLAEAGSGGRLILGVSDNVPPDADLGRLDRIRERIEA